MARVVPCSSIDFNEYSPAGSVARLTVKLKGTLAFTSTVWALAAVVPNRASAAAIKKFLFIFFSSFRLSADLLHLLKRKACARKKTATLHKNNCGASLSSPPRACSARFRVVNQELKTIEEGTEKVVQRGRRTQAIISAPREVLSAQQSGRSHTTSTAMAGRRFAGPVCTLRDAAAGSSQN